MALPELCTLGQRASILKPAPNLKVLPVVAVSYTGRLRAEAGLPMSLRRCAAWAMTEVGILSLAQGPMNLPTANFSPTALMPPMWSM